jgi:CBS domain-containing protein
MATSKWGSATIEEVMRRDVQRISSDMLVADAAREMLDMDVGCLLVWEGNGIVGIVTDRDITCRAVAEARNPETTTVQDVMSKDVFTCFNDQSLSSAAQIMREKKVRRLPVLDHENHVVGILTLSDLSINNTPELVAGVFRAMYSYQ